MTTSHKITVSALTLAVLLLMVGSVTATYLIMEGRQRAAVTQAQADASKLVVVEQQKIIEASNAASLKRDQDFRQWQDQHGRDVAAVNTADKAIAALNKLGSGIEIKAAPTSSDPNAKEFLIPAEQAIPLFQKAAQCQADEKSLEKCQGDLEDKRKAADAAMTQRDEWEKTSGRWEKLAKGGSRWNKAWYAFKISGAAAAGAAPGAYSRNAKASMIGAGAGALLCAIFCKH